MNNFEKENNLENVETESKNKQKKQFPWVAILIVFVLLSGVTMTTAKGFTYSQYIRICLQKWGILEMAEEVISQKPLPMEDGTTEFEGNLELDSENNAPTSTEYIDAHIYGDAFLSVGEPLPLINPDTNSEDVLFGFRIYENPTYEYTDGTITSVVDPGTEIYKSGLVKPGYAIEWIASNYLSNDENSILIYIDFYNQDGMQYVGGNFWFPVNITITK